MEADRTLHSRARDKAAAAAGILSFPLFSLASSLALLAITVPGLSSCAESQAEPVIPITNSRSWPIPPMGPKLPGPRSVAVTAKDEVILLDNGGRVLVFDEKGELLRQWTMPEYDIGRPEGVVALRDGRIVVCDTHYHRVVIFEEDGKVERMFGTLGHNIGQFVYPVAVTADPDENLYVGEYGGNDRIQVFTPEGEFLRAFGSFGMDAGQFQRPSGIAWQDGSIIVADAINNRIQKFTDEGTFEGVLSKTDAGLYFPYDLCIGRDGTYFIIEYGSGRITRMGRDGEILGRYGSTGRGANQFVTPWGIAIDSKDRLRVADTGNRRIIALEMAKSSERL